MKKLIVLFYTLFLFGCNTGVNQKNDKIIIEELKKEWTHSREEETDSIKIYRPSDYKEFPASRYRQIFSFLDSGKCEYSILASNDAHFSEQGFWSYNENEQIITITDTTQTIIKRIEVIEVTKELLKFDEF